MIAILKSGSTGGGARSWIRYVASFVPPRMASSGRYRYIISKRYHTSRKTITICCADTAITPSPGHLHRCIDNITEPTPSHLAASGDADSPAALIFGLTTLMMRLRFLISTTHRKLRRLVMRALTSQNFALLFHLCFLTRIHHRSHHAPAVPHITCR